MDLIHIVVTIVLVGFAVGALSDMLAFKPFFKNLIYAVAVIWLVYLVMGWAGVQLPR